MYTDLVKVLKIWWWSTAVVANLMSNGSSEYDFLHAFMETAELHVFIFWQSENETSEVQKWATFWNLPVWFGSYYRPSRMDCWVPGDVVYHYTNEGNLSKD